MKHWGDILSGMGTFAVSILSCSICPMCLPLYASLLGLIGVEIIDTQLYFLPIMGFFSAITLILMGYQIRKHHGSWGLFALTATSAISMLLSFSFGYDYLLYASVITFMGSILWNKWILSRHGKECC